MVSIKVDLRSVNFSRANDLKRIKFGLFVKPHVSNKMLITVIVTKSAEKTFLILDAATRGVL